MSFFDRPWTFWYTVMYTGLMTFFGIQAMKRWGFDRKDKFQIWRFTGLISFQWIFFFLVPEFLFQWAMKYQWVGEKLANDPTFADQAWRAYGIVYAWPLFFYTFFYDPHKIWIVWGVLLTFVIIPVFVLLRYGSKPSATLHQCKLHQTKQDGAHVQCHHEDSNAILHPVYRRVAVCVLSVQ